MNARCSIYWRRTAGLATFLLFPCVSVPAQITVTSENDVTQNDRIADKLLSRPITIDLRNVPRKRAIDMAASLARVPVQYRTSLFDAYKDSVTVQLKNTSLRVVLEQVLAGTTLRVVPDGPTQLAIVDGGRGVSAAAEDVGEISGRVTDSLKGEGLSGVTVSVEGTKLTAVTNGKGEFVISNVSAGPHSVRFKLLGYAGTIRSVTVEAKRRAVLRVVLKETVSMLSGVVTTATGAQRRLEVSSSVTTLNVDSIMQTAPIRSVTDLLETRVPGLQVLRTSGTPGDPSRLRLRGTSSINGNNAPIVIVDGVRITSTDGGKNAASGTLFNNNRGYAAPSSLDQIDPNLIEKIEVFKGPSASSLYGSDAANGVISITTKRGKPGETQWNTTLNMGTSGIPGRFRENWYRFGQPVNGVHTLCDFWEKCEIDSVVSFQALNDSRFSPIGRASTGNVSATFSGGTEQLLYSVTGSVSTQQGLSKLPGLIDEVYKSALGVAPPSWMRRPDQYQTLSGGNSITVTVSPSMTVLLNNSVTRSEQKRTSLSVNAAEQLLGRYIDAGSTGNDFYGNPILAGYQERANTTMLTSQHNISFRWQARPSIPVQITAGMNPGRNTGSVFLPSGMPSILLNGINGSSGDTTGALSIANVNLMSSSLGANTTIPVNLMNGMRLDLAAGLDFVRVDNSSQTISTTYVPVGVTNPTNFVQEYTESSQSKTASSTYGYFLEPRLALGSRVFVHTGLRLDGGSASGDRVGLTSYPKIGISWMAIDNMTPDETEKSWRSLVSQLRIRTSFGHAGVQPNPLQHLRLLQARTYTEVDQTTVIPIYNLTELGNDLLKPERAVEFEGGADVELLNQRISAGVTLYRKHQRDAIMELAVAPSVGIREGSRQYVNIGDVLNNGLELQVSAQAIQTNQVRWDISGILSQRTNRLTRKADGVNASGIESRALVVGYPLFGYWANPIIGFSDRNGDGIFQGDEIAIADSAVYRGSSEPRHTMAFNSTLGLLNGRLTASASIEYQHGLTQYNHNAIQAIRSAANSPNATPMDLVIAQVSGAGGGGERGTDYYLTQTVNVLRLRTLSIGYTIPNTITRMLRVRNATVSVQGSNLGLRTSYRGKDPNVNGYNTGHGSGDFGQFPQPREWILRFNLSH